MSTIPAHMHLWSWGISWLCSDMWSVMWSSVTHSCATVRSRRRSCHKPGGVQAHERGKSLRHPVSYHRHGAEYNADLQQGQRHLCAPFFLFKSFIIRAPAPHESATQCCPSKFAGAFEPRLGTEPIQTWPLIFPFSLNPVVVCGRWLLEVCCWWLSARLAFSARITRTAETQRSFSLVHWPRPPRSLLNIH